MEKTLLDFTAQKARELMAAPTCCKELKDEIGRAHV